MTIRKEKGELVAVCDVCGETLPGPFDDFDEARAAVKHAGWKTTWDDDDQMWVNLCLDCK